MSRIAPDWDDDFIIHDCPACHGEGRITNYRESYSYECEECEGTGEAPYPTQPVECDDDLVDA